MKRTQTLVQLNDELLAELDALRARGGGRSRSAVIREAIERYLAAQSEQAIDQAIVDGYTRQPPHDLGAQWAVRASITAESWDEPR
jgi:Arc/MetJ-type ribon-helix-helix transcriptional regulator